MKWRERPLCFSGAPGDCSIFSSDFSCSLTTNTLPVAAPDHNRDAPRNSPPLFSPGSSLKPPRDPLKCPQGKTLSVSPASTYPPPEPHSAAPPSSYTPVPFCPATRLAFEMNCDDQFESLQPLWNALSLKHRACVYNLFFLVSRR